MVLFKINWGCTSWQVDRRTQTTTHADLWDLRIQASVWDVLSWCAPIKVKLSDTLIHAQLESIQSYVPIQAALYDTVFLRNYGPTHNMYQNMYLLYSSWAASCINNMYLLRWFITFSNTMGCTHSCSAGMSTKLYIPIQADL